MDTCYKNAKAENCIPLEEKFLQKVPLEDLPDLIEAEALKYGVNINISSFPSYRAKLMNDLKLLFQRGDLAAFEQSAIVGFLSCFIFKQIHFRSYYNVQMECLHTKLNSLIFSLIIQSMHVVGQNLLI